MPPQILAYEQSVNAAPILILNAQTASHSFALHWNPLACLDDAFWRAEPRDAVLMG
jgi:hypothetical protein